MTCPVAISKAANRSSVPCRLLVGAFVGAHDLAAVGGGSRHTQSSISRPGYRAFHPRKSPKPSQVDIKIEAHDFRRLGDEFLVCTHTPGALALQCFPYATPAKPRAPSSSAAPPPPRRPTLHATNGTREPEESNGWLCRHGDDCQRLAQRCKGAMGPAGAAMRAGIFDGQPLGHLINPREPRNKLHQLARTKHDRSAPLPCPAGLDRLQERKHRREGQRLPC